MLIDENKISRINQSFQYKYLQIPILKVTMILRRTKEQKSQFGGSLLSKVAIAAEQDICGN